MFSTLPNRNFNFWVTFILSSANAFNLDQLKNLSFGIGLTLYQAINFYTGPNWKHLQTANQYFPLFPHNIFKRSYFQGCKPFPKRQALVFTCLQLKYLKTLWEKEKLLMTSNSSFPHNVFYQFPELSTIFIKFEIVGCKLFQFGRVWNWSFEKRLKVRIVW